MGGIAERGGGAWLDGGLGRGGEMVGEAMLDSGEAVEG